MNTHRLQGMTAWISGATSGIGEATARLFAREGAGVTVAGCDVGRGLRIVDDILREGGQALWSQCDVSQPEAVRGSIEQTVHKFGALHTLVNNAGMVQVKMLHECTDQDWDYLMAVNVKSMFWAFTAALPHLRRQRRSQIVNVGSVGSFIGQAATPLYTVSKHAVLGLTRSIALDYAADGIRCNCVCPGVTDTPMLREHFEHLDNQTGIEEALVQRLTRVPIGMALTPHDVAKTILFLSCDDSAGITGTPLVIDGGYLAAAEWNTGMSAHIREDLHAYPTGGR